MIKATQMGIMGKESTNRVSAAQTKEIENRLKEMTAEALQKAAENQKQEVFKIDKAKIDQIPQKQKEDYQSELGIEIENKEAEKEIDFELDKSEKVSNKIESEIEKDFERKFETEVEFEAEQETKERAEKIEKNQEIQKVKTPLEKENLKTPPTDLGEKSKESASEIQHRKEKVELFEEAGSRKVEKLQEQIRSTIGESADEGTIKKKMLELTKALFREKSTQEREKLKMEITVLKNLLTSRTGTPLSKTEEKRGKQSETGIKKDSTNERVYEALLLTQKSDLAQTKEQITDSYRKQFDSLKKRSQVQMAAAENPAAKRRIFDTLQNTLNEVASQIPQTVNKYLEFTTKKHSAELESLSQKLSNEPAIQKKARSKLDEIKSQYPSEFESIKGVVGREIQNMLEVLGSEILQQVGKKDQEELTRDIVVEISDMDEGTLLYYLHSKEPNYYKEYERKQISKAQALIKAKTVMAKEKGLNDDLIKKYFTQ